MKPLWWSLAPGACLGGNGILVESLVLKAIFWR